MSDARVRDVMHAGVISCSLETGLEEVAAIMRERKISAVVVVDDGNVVGIISQTDLVNTAFVQPYMRYWRGMSARHLMSKPVVSVRPEAPLTQALELLQSHRIHRLVVTEATGGGERPVGILSMSDLVQVLGGQSS